MRRAILVTAYGSILVYRSAAFPAHVAGVLLSMIVIFPNVGRLIAFGVLTVLLIFEVAPRYRPVPIIVLPTLFLWLIGQNQEPAGPAMPLGWLGACAIWYGGPFLRRRQ